ncbi:hypothetical protein ABPG74_003636 [Tetrahymena malaccensis]
MDSTYQFSTLNSLAYPLKSYGLPLQSSTYQPSNITGTSNLDDQVKAIAIQYQYTSTYKASTNLPQTIQQMPNQITSSSEYNSSLPNSNQTQGIYSTSLGNNAFQYQKVDQKTGIGLENNTQYGQAGGIYSQNYGLSGQFVSNLGNSIKDTDYKQSNSFQPQLQQQQVKSETQQIDAANDQSREQFRLKVDEIVNQVKKNMYYQASGADSSKNTNFVNGEQQKQQFSSFETNYGLTQNKVQTPLKYSELSSDLNKITSSYNQAQGINNLKVDSSPVSSFNTYDKLNKTFNSVVYQGSQLSSSVPIQLEQKNQNFTSLLNDQIGKDINKNNTSGYNFISSQGNNIPIQNNQMLQTSPYQQLQKQNTYSEQSLNMQNSYKQLSPLNKILLSDSYNLKSNFDNQNTFKNYDFSSNFSKYNPLSSSFDKSSNNQPQYETKSYVSNNFIQGSGITNPTALAQKQNNQSEIPSELQSVNLKQSYTANQIQDLNYYNNQSSLQSNQELYKQAPINIDQTKYLAREKSVEKVQTATGNVEEQKIQQPGQQQNLELMKRSQSFSEKKNSQVGSPNKQSIFSNLNSQNVNSQNDQIVANNQQFFSDAKDDDTLNQLSQQNNTFETLQNETQNIEIQNETVKRSKNNQQISQQQNTPIKEFEERQQKHSPKSSKSNKQDCFTEDRKDEVINEEQIELNQWLDPVFQDFIKKNFSKDQKKRLILQLQKQISCDGEDLLDEQEESKQSPQSKKNAAKKQQKTSSSSRSPKGSPSSQQQTEQNKKTLNLYERYNKLKNQKIKEDNKPNSKPSQITDIKSEEQQLEYIQFSQRCKAELEKQQKMQKSKKGRSGLFSENGQENLNHIIDLKHKQNIAQSMESLESNENIIMTKESKLLLQEIYNEVQNALKKYDYIIQENQKNRKNQDQIRKDQANQNSDTNSDILNNGITAQSLQSNYSQMRFETQNQEQEDQIQKQKKPVPNKNYYQSKTPQNFNRKNMNQTSKSSLSSVFKADNKSLSINMNQHSDSHSTILTSPIPNQENSPAKNIKEKGNTRGVSNFDGQRISKMDENEAESAFNNRKQEIIKVLQHHSKQRKNSIQQKPMNHSISKGNNLSSHVRTPSNSISQRNSQIMQNQNNEYDLNNSSTSGNKQKANSLLNKFLSPKNSISKSKLQQEVGSPSQSLKASLFVTKETQQVKNSQHFDKKAYQLSEQPIDISQKKENDKKQQAQEDRTKLKAIDVATVNSIISDSIVPLEKVKKASKGNDESKQKIRKKSILQINLLEKEAFEINIADLDKKKKQSIKEKKEKIEKIYHQAQQSISINEKQIQQKKQNLEQPVSDKNIQISQLEDEGLANSNSQRQFYQNQILSNKLIDDNENNLNNEAPERLIKRSNSASYNIFQQKKLAILNDIEDLNKMIEQENQNQEEVIVFEQPQSQQNIQSNEEKNAQNKQYQEQKKAASRQSSKHQNQPLSRKSSTNNHHQQLQIQQEYPYPKIAGITQTKSVTEFYSDNQAQTKLVAPLIPLTKIRDQDSSDVQSFQGSNNDQDKDANFQYNKEKFLQQLKQQNNQQNMQKEVKRVSSQHTIQNKDSYQQFDRQSYGTLKKKENQQKENNQANSAQKLYQKNQRGNIYQGQEEEDQDEEVHQINIYRSLSPNRYQQSNSQTNFHERNKKWLEDKKNKIEETQKNYNYKEMKECTFKPQTNKQLIKYNPYIHKDQIKYQKSNNTYQQNSKSQKVNVSPRNIPPNQQLKNSEQQQLAQENNKQLNTQSSRNKKDSEDLQRLQGLQSPIVQRYSEVEFWSQSDASVFKAINDIDTSYQNELKKEINDVLDIIQGFQNNVSEKAGSNSKQPINKKNKVTKEQASKLINSQKFKL